MRRKIIRQGHNTLTVSLPRKWCDNHELKEGNEIEVDEKGNCLILSKEAFRGAGQVTVDVTGLDSSSIRLLVQSLYTYGYDIIVITTKEEMTERHLADTKISVASVMNHIVNVLVGAELVSSAGNSYRIEVITEDSREKFDTILRRIFLLINEMFDVLNEAIKNGDKSMMESIAYKYNNVKRFANYALRLLNKFGYEDADKTTFYFTIINFLSKIIEIIKHYSGDVMGGGIFLLNKKLPIALSRKAADLIVEVADLFKLYGETFYKYDLHKVSEIHRKRDLFKIKVYQGYESLTKGEIFVVLSLLPITDIMLDLIELRMAIGYK